MKYLINNEEHPLCDLWLFYAALVEAEKADLDKASALFEHALTGDAGSIDVISQLSGGMLTFVPVQQHN
jgi:hypothetical protein